MSAFHWADPERLITLIVRIFRECSYYIYLDLGSGLKKILKKTQLN